MVGANMRRVREAAGRRQEDVAAAAREWGIRWTRSTVAEAEAGTKPLNAAELLLLSRILQAAGCDAPGLAALLDDGGRWVRVGGVLHEPGLLAKGLSARPGPARPRGTGDVVERIRHRDAEQVAARRLGWTPLELAVGALELWGRGLAEERDARVAAAAPGEVSAATLRALRGRVSRHLYGELRAAGRPHIRES